MGSLRIEDILISKNSKTGLSINVLSCQPTPWCFDHCYARARTGELANNGPITWQTQRAAYKANEQAIIKASREGRLEEIGGKIVDAMKRAGLDHLRGNGVGDLFPELCELYAFVGKAGGKVFLFSRIPEMIYYLVALHTDLGGEWPYILGSIDPSTSLYATNRLALATAYSNADVNPTLAYATDRADDPCNRPYSEYYKVIFGYHSNHTRTIIDHPKACPATNGEDIKCKECRRCYGPL